jgi:hypothetical protein
MQRIEREIHQLARRIPMALQARESHRAVRKRCAEFAVEISLPAVDRADVKLDLVRPVVVDRLASRVEIAGGEDWNRSSERVVWLCEGLYANLAQRRLILGARALAVHVKPLAVA